MILAQGGIWAIQRWPCSPIWQQIDGPIGLKANRQSALSLTLDRPE